MKKLQIIVLLVGVLTLTSCAQSSAVKLAALTTSIIYKEENKIRGADIKRMGYTFAFYERKTKKGKIKRAAVLKTPSGMKIPVDYFERTNTVTVNNEEIYKDKTGKFILEFGKVKPFYKKVYLE